MSVGSSDVGGAGRAADLRRSRLARKAAASRAFRSGFPPDDAAVFMASFCNRKAMGRQERSLPERKQGLIKIDDKGADNRAFALSFYLDSDAIVSADTLRNLRKRQLDLSMPQRRERWSCLLSKSNLQGASVGWGLRCVPKRFERPQVLFL